VTFCFKRHPLRLAKAHQPTSTGFAAIVHNVSKKSRTTKLFSIKINKKLEKDNTFRSQRQKMDALHHIGLIDGSNCQERVSLQSRNLLGSSEIFSDFGPWSPQNPESVQVLQGTNPKKNFEDPAKFRD